MERAAAGRHAAPLIERPTPLSHGRVVRHPAGPVDHGRVVRYPPGPAIEIAPVGLRPVVPLQGRCLYHGL